MQIRCALAFAGLLARAAVAQTAPPAELSAAQELEMWSDIRRSVETLRRDSILPLPDAGVNVTYGFPLRLVPGLPEYAGFRVSAFSDHDPAAAAVRDYNNGSRTYDGHRGTDYALWPFSWNRVDAGEMQVVAAAAGTIAFKSDTDVTDHNPCDAGGNGDPWNYIAVAHADGRLTMYGHLRHNSLTAKGIGATVAAGEYLGTAASSGSSSGPHLHFEARYGSYANNEWIDPYAGPASQPESLWASQRPYLDSAINRLSTHSSPPTTANSCALTVTNLQDSFTAPVNIYFYAFYRDFQGPLPTQLAIYRPDGSTFQSWQYTTGTAFASAWSGSWLYNFPLGSPGGTWRFEALYNGQAYQTFFNVNAPTSIAVTSPNGGEQWHRQVAHPVTWSDNLGGEVNIALFLDSVFLTTLASNTASDGLYLWTPDAGLAVGPGYSIRVASVTNPSLSDASNATFSLIDALFVDGFESGSTAAWTDAEP